MNQKRTAQGFPDRNVPGDPRTLRAIQSRTPKGTGEVHHVPGGTILTTNPRTRARRKLLPFEITVTADTLKATAGILDGDSIAETTESSPANGTWYLEAKVTINSSTGVVTATAVDWVSSETSDTTTDFHMTVGTVTVSDGVPDAKSIVQGAYGPIFAIVHGEVDDKWGVLIF